MGQFYLSTGRALTVAIDSYINDGRYSTASPVLPAPSPKDLEKVATLTPLVTLEPGVTHTKLAQQIGRLMSADRKV